MTMHLPPLSVVSNNMTLRFTEITPGDIEKGFVPGYHFRILYGADRIDVGHVNVRIGDTPHVTLCAGHIGFFIEERYRGNGFAYQGCMALSGFVSRVLGEAIITVDPDNIASRRTIEKLGADFLDEVLVPPCDPHYARGSRIKRRYLWRPDPVV